MDEGSGSKDVEAGAAADAGGPGEVRIRSATGRVLQVRKAQSTHFTRAKQQLFLNALAATCNASEASRVAGIGRFAARDLRRRSPAFAALYDEALETGYAYLEEQLLARAVEALDGLVIDPEAAPVPPLPPLGAAEAAGQGGAGVGAGAGAVGMAAGPRAGVLSGRGLPVAYQLAFMVLSQHRARRDRGPRGGKAKRLTSAEVDALLTQKLDRLDRQRRRTALAPLLDAVPDGGAIALLPAGRPEEAA